MATAALLREQFYKAKEYQETLDKHFKDPDENDKPEYDMKLEALLPVLSGKLVVKAHAHRADDIVTALRIKKEFNLDMTIDHCTEGWMMADVLKEAGVDVILGPLLTDRSKVELKNMNIAGPGIMAKAGLPIAIMSDHPCIPVQYLLMSAVVAAKEGLDRGHSTRGYHDQCCKKLPYSRQSGQH
jgi:imidazolonepropionase-like amidohydrolase